MIRAEMREWMRIRYGVQTPREKWEVNRDLFLQETLGSDEDAYIREFGLCPMAGLQPSWQENPSNYALNSFIDAACDRCNRDANVSDALNFFDLNVPASPQDIMGPLQLDLGSLPGFPDGAINRVKRAFWSPGPDGNGEPFQRLTPANLTRLDALGDDYMNMGPGSPYRFAIEGYTFFLMTANDADGVLRFRLSSKMLAPQDDNEGFDSIPDSYDSAILYVALVEGARSLPNDTEMIQRAQGYQAYADAALASVAKWYDSDPNAEFQPQISFDARNIRRYRRN